MSDFLNSEKLENITNKEMEDMADSLSAYINDYDRYIIKEGVNKDEYRKAKKTVKSLIKKLRNHDRSVFRT